MTLCISFAHFLVPFCYVPDRGVYQIAELQVHKVILHLDFIHPFINSQKKRVFLTFTLYRTSFTKYKEFKNSGIIISAPGN